MVIINNNSKKNNDNKNDKHNISINNHNDNNNDNNNGYIYICRNIKRKIMRKERTRANLDMMSYDSPRQTASSQQVDPYPPCV